VIAQIEAGKAVFSDRYLFSSLAYQGETLSDDLAVSLNRDFPLPEVLLFFDLDAEAAMGRVERRGEDREIYETIAFQRRVRDDTAKSSPVSSARNRKSRRPRRRIRATRG
jgi:dTMP kinase